MKFSFLIPILLSGIMSLSAQITLQKIGNKQTVKIPLETNIRLIFPTKSSNDSCNCYQSYYGIFKGMQDNRVNMLVFFDERLFTDENGVGKNIKTSYSYTKDKLATSLLTDKLIAISKPNNINKRIQEAGVVLATSAIIQSLIIAPFFDTQLRKKSDKIAFGTFIIGISTAFLKTEKKYYFQQPKNKKKQALWQLKKHTE